MISYADDFPDVVVIAHRGHPPSSVYHFAGQPRISYSVYDGEAVPFDWRMCSSAHVPTSVYGAPPVSASAPAPEYNNPVLEHARRVLYGKESPEATKSEHSRVRGG